MVLTLPFPRPSCICSAKLIIVLTVESLLRRRKQTSWDRNRRGKIKLHLSDLSCVFEDWSVGSACHRSVLGAHYQGTTLTRVLKGETKIHDAVTPALFLLLASSTWKIMLLDLFTNGSGFAEMFEEHNLAWANYPSQILVFMAQVLFIPEVFLQWDALVRVGEVFWGALVGSPFCPVTSSHRGLSSVSNVKDFWKFNIFGSWPNSLFSWAPCWRLRALLSVHALGQSPQSELLACRRPWQGSTYSSSELVLSVRDLRGNQVMRRLTWSETSSSVGTSSYPNSLRWQLCKA